MRFRDIPQFTQCAGYMVNVGLDYLADHVFHYVKEYGLDLSPDFQRGYVWTPEQKTRFVEYLLRGGRSGLDIYTNCPMWQHGHLGPQYDDAWFVLVDGKQRLEATLGFLNNEVPVFGGHFFREFTDKPRITQCNFRWHVNTLQTREECLQWYLDLNTGGTVHSEEELEKVRRLIAEGGQYVRPSPQAMLDEIRVERPIFQAVIEYRERQKQEREEVAAARAAAEVAKKSKKRGKK